MLGYIEAGHLQFDSRRLQDTERNFTTIATTVHGLLVSFLHRTNRFTLRNPRTLAEEFHAAKRVAKQKAKESQEPLKDI